MTGYPHIDQPWKKFYDNVSTLNYPDCSITTYLRVKSKNYNNDIALSYYGNEIDYRTFWEQVDNASRALTYIGAKKNDRVMFLVPNIPESGYLWLGASQIGLTSDFFDPRPDSMDMKSNAEKVFEVLKIEHTKFIVALDQCYLAMLTPIEDRIKEIGVEIIVILSAADSMNFKGKLSYLKDAFEYAKIANIKKGIKSPKLKAVKAVRKKIQNMKKSSEALAMAKSQSPLQIIDYKRLVDDARSTTFIKDDDPDAISYIGHTSGTSTGRPKPIPLTNRNLISENEKLLAMGISNGHKKRVLHILPFFAPFGASNNYLLNIARGSYSIEVPEFQLSEVGYLILKHKPHLIMGAPSWMSSLVDCFYLKNKDLSFLRHITYGGDSMTKQDEIALEKWLVEHNSDAKIVKGHGMSECCGCSSYSQGNYSRYESIGIPLPGIIYTLVNPEVMDHLEPIGFVGEENEIHGELAISSESVTPGVLDGEVIVPHYEMDGKSYIRTKDIVTMDRDGLFYFNSRKDRMFTRFDGYKYKPYVVEGVIEEHSSVKYCRITGYYDSFVHGLMAIAHIVLQDAETHQYTEKELVELTKQIVAEKIINNPNMSSRQIPRKFRYRSSLPLTRNSKVNFKALSDEGLDGSEITVEVDENNLTVGEIRVFGSEV